MSKWSETDDPDKFARGFGLRVAIWTILIILFFGLIGLAIWGFRVATAPVKGAGDAYVQKESASNRITQQALFEDLYADYQSTIAKIPAAKAAADASPKSQIKATELTGLINYCISVAGDYNAESNKYLAADFKRIDLPYELDRAACNS